MSVIELFIWVYKLFVVEFYFGVYCRVGVVLVIVENVGGC